MLGETVEKVILDNEEKSTTYAETGATGLLLGSVKLPAPKNQPVVGHIYLWTIEAKCVGEAGRVALKLWDGIEEYEADRLVPTVPETAYQFSASCTEGTSIYPTSRSQKGNTSLELRFYLIGVPLNPNACQYCRNLVVTVVPLYKV